jgi:hypothetical protein
MATVMLRAVLPAAFLRRAGAEVFQTPEVMVGAVVTLSMALRLRVDQPIW